MAASVGESLLDNVNAHCQMQSAIFSNVWQDSNFARGNVDSDVIGDLQCLMTKLPTCMQNAGKEIFVKNPEFAWSVVGVVSSSLIVGYAAYRYIECTNVVVEIKEYVINIFKDVDRYIREANEIVGDVFLTLSGEPTPCDTVVSTSKNQEILVQKMRYAELKLEAAEKLLVRGRTKIEKTLESYKCRRNISLGATAVGFVAFTGLGGIIATMFPPAGLLVMAGTAVRVGVGSAAAVGSVSIAVWLALFIKSLKNLEKMEGALLSSWEHYDRRDIEHGLVSKRVDELNSMIIELAKDDCRIASVEVVKAFSSRFG